MDDQFAHGRQQLHLLADLSNGCELLLARIFKNFFLVSVVVDFQAMDRVTHTWHYILHGVVLTEQMQLRKFLWQVEGLDGLG